MTMPHNFLSLPKLVNSAPVVYDAAGRKWRWGNGATARETFNGIDFVGGQLEGFLHDKGRVAPERNEFGGIARLRAEYWRQDHLGNTRVAFSDQNGDGFIATRDNPATPENEVEIMQENHYYPFGMNHDGRWFGPEDPENRRTYNGKEYTDELGLDWYDYGARWYDAALGRWNAVDPMGEMMLRSQLMFMCATIR
jgi:RHS repeat-associated protein